MSKPELSPTSESMPETTPETTPQATIEEMRVQLARLKQASAITIPGYTVTSHAPVVGPLLAGLRRMFTSHLREPYIDPILERQEAFNRELVQTVEQLALRLEHERLERERQPSLAKTPDRETLAQARRTLDECVQELAGWLDQTPEPSKGQIQPDSGATPSREEMAALRSRLESVREALGCADAK